MAFLAETAHAVSKVTSGTRVALNTWLNCPWKSRSAPKQWSKQRHNATMSACAAGRGAGASGTPSESFATSPPPLPPPPPPNVLPSRPLTPLAPQRAHTKKARCEAPLVFYVGLQKAGTTSFMALAASLGYRAIKLANPGSPVYTHADFERTYYANSTSALTTVFDSEKLLPLAIRHIQASTTIASTSLKLSAKYRQARVRYSYDRSCVSPLLQRLPHLCVALPTRPRLSTRPVRRLRAAL